MARTSNDNLVLEMDVASWGLRRKLSQKVSQLYSQSVQAQVNRRQTKVMVIYYDPENFEKQKGKQQVKVSAQECEVSRMDRILKGARDGVNVVYEDKDCLAV